MDDNPIRFNIGFIDWIKSHKFERVDHRKNKRKDEEMEIIAKAGGSRDFRKKPLNFVAILLAYSYEKTYPKCFEEWKLLQQVVEAEKDSCLECICTANNAKSGRYIENTNNRNVLLIGCDCADMYGKLFKGQPSPKRYYDENLIRTGLSNFKEMVQQNPLAAAKLIAVGVGSVVVVQFFCCAIS